MAYVSHDRNLSETVLKLFSAATGTVYDIEANRTAGLVNCSLSKKAHPHADVFWNSEVDWMLQLKTRCTCAILFNH